MNWVRRLDAWQRTRPGLIVSAVLALILVLIFGSSAIDSGSLLDYAITLLSLASAVQNIVQFATYGKGKRE